jgi:hypothetical protein
MKRNPTLDDLVPCNVDAEKAILGAMTTMLVAQKLNCRGIAIELNAEYIEIGKRRLQQEVFAFSDPCSLTPDPCEAELSA